MQICTACENLEDYLNTGGVRYEEPEVTNTASDLGTGGQKLVKCLYGFGVRRDGSIHKREAERA